MTPQLTAARLALADALEHLDECYHVFRVTPSYDNAEHGLRHACLDAHEAARRVNALEQAHWRNVTHTADTSIPTP